MRPYLSEPELLGYEAPLFLPLSLSLFYLSEPELAVACLAAAYKAAAAWAKIGIRIAVARLHTSAYVSIRLRTAYVSIRHLGGPLPAALPLM